MPPSWNLQKQTTLSHNSCGESDGVLMQWAGLGHRNIFLTWFSLTSVILSLAQVLNGKRAGSSASSRCGAVFITVQPHLCLKFKILYMWLDS